MAISPNVGFRDTFDLLVDLCTPEPRVGDVAAVTEVLVKLMTDTPRVVTTLEMQYYYVNIKFSNIVVNIALLASVSLPEQLKLVKLRY